MQVRDVSLAKITHFVHAVAPILCRTQSKSVPTPHLKPLTVAIDCRERDPMDPYLHYSDFDFIPYLLSQAFPPLLSKICFH